MAKELEPRREAIIDRAVRDFGREEQRAILEHPSVDELVGYQQGRLAEQAAEQVRCHLTSCRECAEDVLELEAWGPELPINPALVPPAEETTARWRAFRQRLAEEKDLPRVAALTVGVAPRGSRVDLPPPPGRSWFGLYLPLAASIVLAVTGIAAWLGSGMKEPGGVGTNPFVFDLVPDAANRSRAAALQEVEVPAGMNLLVPRLNLGDQTPHTAYRAEIFDVAGTPVWRQVGLIRQPAGDFTVLISRQQLSPGSYRLKLLGDRAGEEVELASFSFLLRYLPAE